MKVWVIETVDYDPFVEGVANSPEEARTFLRRTYHYATSWTDRPLGTVGHFECIPGQCTKHDTNFTFTEYELQGEPP